MLPYVLFSFILGIVFFVGEQYLHVSYVTPEWRVLLAFFLSVSLLTNRLHELSRQEVGRSMAVLPLVGTVLRLLLSMIFFATMVLRGLPNRKLFVVTFVVLYLCYLGFEIALSNRKLRRNS